MEKQAKPQEAGCRKGILSVSQELKAIQKRKNQTLGYMTNMRELSTLSNYHCHHNASCVKCQRLYPQMIRVGCVIFCSICVQEEFSSSDPVRKERENYLKWLRKQNNIEEDDEDQG